MNSEPTSSSRFQEIAGLLRLGKPAQALKESRTLADDPDAEAQKVRVYLLLLNQKYPEVDSLCTRLLTRGMDHDLLVWRGIARADLGLWFSSLEDLTLAQQFFPEESTFRHIAYTTHRACKSISDGMRLDGGTYHDFYERARVYLLAGDLKRGIRDLNSAEKIKPHASELARLRSQASFAEGNLEESLKQVELYLNEHPEDVNAQLHKAKIRAMTGRMRVALVVLHRLASQITDDEISRLKLAQCRFEIRDFIGAIHDFTAILASNPDLTSGLLGRAKAYLEIRRYDEAILDLQNVLRLERPNAITLILLGNAKLAKGLIKEASSDLKAAMKLEPRNWQASLGYAKVKNMRQKRSEALQIASKLAKKNPNQHEIEQFLGSVCFDEKDFVSAIYHFSEAVEKCLTSYHASACLYRRGSARLENQQAAEAVEDFDLALQLRPYHVGTLVWRGYAHANLNQWAAAIADLQSAMDLNPLASRQYKKLGDHIAQHALKHFAGVIQNNSSDAEAFFNRGVAHLFLGQTSEAHDDFQKCLSLNPKHSEAEARLGALYLEKGQSKKAYNLFSDAIKSHSSPTVLLLRADAMLQLGVTQPALLDIKNAIRTSRDNYRLYLRRGELYANAGRTTKALDDFTLSIALNFDNYQAYRERARLLASKNHLQEAVRDLTLSLHFYYRQPELLVDRAQLHFQLEDFEQAAADFEQALSFELPDDRQLEAYIGRARAILNLDRGQESLTWLTKAIHRFHTPQEWARLVKARAEVFLEMGRFERASADARIASKLNPDPVFSADCYYLRALCSHYHNDREHTLKTLEKACALDENHAAAELALDWFRNMADQPPKKWDQRPKKVRPQRPQAESNHPGFTINLEKFSAEPPMDLWLVKKGDSEFGPIPLKTVADWAREGRIDEHSRLFRTDWGKWKKAGLLASTEDAPSNPPIV